MKDYIIFYLIVFGSFFITYLLKLFNPSLEKKTFTLPPFFNGLAGLLIGLLKLFWIIFFFWLWIAPVMPLISLFNDGKRYSEIDNGIVSLLSFLLAFLITTLVSLGLGYVTANPLLKLEDKFLKFDNDGKFFKIRPFASGFIIIVYGISIFIGHWWYLPSREAICYRFLEGKYTEEKAIDKWTETGGRYGNINMLNNCAKYIPYVDQKKLIIKKEE